MTLGKKFIQKIDSLIPGNGNQSITNEHTIVVVNNSLHGEVYLKEFTKLGISLEKIAIKNRQKKEFTEESLKKQSEAIARRITYLLENIKIVEIDQSLCIAQLRSKKPQGDDGAITYYEILIQNGDTLTFQRYRYNKKTGERTSSQSFLTLETAEKLLDDFEYILNLT